MQISIEQRATGGHHVDKSGYTAGLEHPPHFAQGLAQVAPVVSRITAEHIIKLAIGKRQTLRRTALGADIAQTTIFGGRADNIEHLLRQVVGHHLVNQCRHMKTDMTGTAPQIQYPGIRLVRQLSL